MTFDNGHRPQAGQRELNGPAIACEACPPSE